MAEMAIYSDSGPLILEVPCADRRGEGYYQVRVLREFATNYAMTAEKIRDLWKVSSQNDVLFSDETNGKVEPFVVIALNPSSIWLEISRGEEIVGVAYVTDVIPGFDANAHFAFWDRVAGGRESIVLMAAEWLMDRYKLKRLSASTPPYQSGTIRFIRSLGFKEEGLKRDAVIYRGRVFPLIMFGLLRSELDESLRKVW